jgi:hypothetical protein
MTLAIERHCLVIDRAVNPAGALGTPACFRVPRRAFGHPGVLWAPRRALGTSACFCKRVKRTTAGTKGSPRVTDSGCLASVARALEAPKQPLLCDGHKTKGSELKKPSVSLIVSTDAREPPSVPHVNNTAVNNGGHTHSVGGRHCCLSGGKFVTRVTARLDSRPAGSNPQKRESSQIPPIERDMEAYRREESKHRLPDKLPVARLEPRARTALHSMKELKSYEHVTKRGA